MYQGYVGIGPLTPKNLLYKYGEIIKNNHESLTIYIYIDEVNRKIQCQPKILFRVIVGNYFFLLNKSPCLFILNKGLKIKLLIKLLILIF